MLKSKRHAVLSFWQNASFFRIAYVIDLFFGMVAFCEGIALVFRCVILTWGFFLFWRHIARDKKFKQVVNYKIAFLFLASQLLTTLLHVVDNLLPNLLAIYHTAVCFFLFYGMCATSDTHTIKKELTTIFRFIVCATTVLSAMGLSVFFINIQIHVGQYWLGIFNNRLIGMYTNSNLLGLSCVISIIGVHILLNPNVAGANRKGTRIFYILSAILNFLSLLLSDSNASFLFLIIYITVILFYNAFVTYKRLPLRKIFEKSVMLLVCCVAITISSFSVRDFCQERVASFVNETHQTQEIIQDSHQAPEALQDDDGSVEVVVVGRSDYDVSSGRITLLKQAMKMYVKNPILGIGRGNIVDYGERYLTGGLIFSDFHNGYVTILVSWGFVGFLIFMIFSLAVAVPMCSMLLQPRLKEKSSLFVNLFAFSLAYCVYSLFEKTLLSEITFMVIIFWLVLGYAMTCVVDYENHKIPF